MATITQPPVAPPPGRNPYRLTVDQYEAMVAAGVLTKRDRVELIDGELVAKMPKGPKHSDVTGQLGERLRGMLIPGWHVRQEQPVRLPDHDEPEPDLAVTRGAFLDYTDHHPGPGDIALLVEIAESTLAEDRRIMARVYATASIPVYWIVNLVDRQIEVYSSPSGGAYAPPAILGEKDRVELVIEGQVVGPIAVVDLLPQRP
jgi:Uma2 family endonuclease